MPSPKSTVSSGNAIRSFTVALGMANALARKSSNKRCRFNDSATACRQRPVSHPSVRLSRQAAYSSPLSRSTWLTWPPCPDCSLGGHRLRITMVMRSLVSSGVANGVPPSSSNACTNVAPLRTDARRDATHATHPMAGNAFDDAFKSSIPSGSNPCFPPCSSLHRPPAHPEPSPVRSLTSYVFRRGHNHTASPNNIAAITPRLPIHPPRFNDSMHVRNRATAVRPAFGCRSILTAGFRAVCLPQIRAALFA